MGIRQGELEKNYIGVPFTPAQVRGMKVGTEFVDHGVRMRVTGVGAAYIDQRGKPAFDITATPVPAIKKHLP